MRKFTYVLVVFALLGCRSKSRGIRYEYLGPSEQKFTYAEKAVLALAQEIHFDWPNYYSGDYEFNIDGPINRVTSPSGWTDLLSFIGAKIWFDHLTNSSFYVYDQNRDNYALNGSYLPELRSEDLRLNCERGFNIPLGGSTNLTDRWDFSFCGGWERVYGSGFDTRMHVVADHGLEFDLIPTYFDEAFGGIVRGIIVRDEIEYGEWVIEFKHEDPAHVYDLNHDSFDEVFASWSAHVVPVPLFGSARTGYFYNVWR